MKRKFKFLWSNEPPNTRTLRPARKRKISR